MKPYIGITLTLLILITWDLFAQDIIILDSSGLTRLHVSHKEELSVEIKLQCNSLSLDLPEVMLLREDGLGNEIVATSQGACLYLAHGLTVGKWRIRAEENSVKVSVQSVKLL